MTPTFLHKLVIGLVVISLPLVFCFGYYSLEQLETSSRLVQAGVVLAYPLALLSSLVFAFGFINSYAKSFRYLALGVCLICLGVLLYVRV